MKSRNVRFFALACALLLALSSDAKAACTYQLGKNPIKLEWTAFKFTEKTGVTGSFNTMTLRGPKQADSLINLARGLSMQIDGTSIESNNPGRNVTISQFFFQKFSPSPDLTAKVTSVEGDDHTGNLSIAITMNGTTKDVPFTYTISKDNQVEAKGSIDMMEFALQSAFDSIHRACETQHTGKDGISKTWTDVDLKLTGRFEKACS